jgi:Bacterial membrane protein YfhO
MRPTRMIALFSLLFTAVFFIEYTPAWRKVHIPYDLEGYHYPLADYAFQAIRHGRFPQWDPTIYSGMSFVGNVQAALFYPPQWVMIAGSIGHPKLTYQAMEDLVFAHVWLAFLLCFLWLNHGKRLHWLASVLGAGIFAFSGLMMLQLQHLGLIGAYSWMPLGFWGIDEAAETRRWRPLWKLVVAFAMCILAGYPPMWVVFAVCAVAYAAARARPVKLTAGAIAAMAVSSLIAAVQLLPAAEASQSKMPDARYTSSSGIKDPAFFISYFAPNYYDFGMNVDRQKNRGKEYLYIGAAALAGLALLVYRRRFQGAAPLLAVLAAALLFLTNPFGLAGRAMEGTFLSQVFSDWYFLAGITAALAALAALGLDAGFRHPGRPWPAWLVTVVIGLTALWSIRLGILWIRQALPLLWLSGVDALIATLLCGALIAIFASSKGRMAVVSAAALIVLSAVEFKAFGTSKRFNASPGPVSNDQTSPFLPGMNRQIYKTLLEHPEYRTASDDHGPDPVELRHSGLTSPQGSDPFLTTQYRNLMEELGHFATNRSFDLDPENENALHLLGVRYFVTAETGPMYQRLLTSPRYRLMTPDGSYYKVFELDDPRPSFGWESPGTAEKTGWEPEKRAFRVQSPEGGIFRLSEQYLPGWKATIDGAEVPIERCHKAFQRIAVSRGGHMVEFRYRSQWLEAGWIISLSSIFLGVAAMWVTRSTG